MKSLMPMSFRGRLGTAALLASVAGCGQSFGETGATVGDIGARLADVTVSPRNALLAVGGTQQLTLQGVSLAGDPVTAFDTVKFVLNTLTDTARIRVSETGLITALAASGSAPLLVNTFAIRGGTARGDQAVIRVTPTVVAGVQLSLQPVAPDSARLATGARKTLAPVLRNPVTGETVASLSLRYHVRLADANRINVYIPAMRLPDDGLYLQAPSASQPPALAQIRAQAAEGTAWVHAELTAYGTVVRDSVLYTLTYPFEGNLQTTKLGTVFTSPSAGRTMTFAPGATIWFAGTFTSNDPTGTTYAFSNPAAVTAANPPATLGGATGNVTELKGFNQSPRRFMTAGSYTWTATATGPAPWGGQTATGTILIK